MEKRRLRWAHLASRDFSSSRGRPSPRVPTTLPAYYAGLRDGIFGTRRVLGGSPLSLKGQPPHSRGSSYLCLALTLADAEAQARGDERRGDTLHP